MGAPNLANSLITKGLVFFLFVGFSFLLYKYLLLPVLTLYPMFVVFEILVTTNA